MTIIKQADAETLRYDSEREKWHYETSTSIGKPKVMLVWDRACIDFEHWYTLSHEGVYFTTIEKKNCKLINCSEDLNVPSDPRNEGILSEHYVGNGNGPIMRRIKYSNPTDGKHYTFLTSELYLPAYLIICFYKHRWDIEKIYHQFKSKFQERKSWATTQEAKMAQATFQCLLHNLALLVEEKIQQEEGFCDMVSQEQNEKRARPPEKGFINQIVQRATQRTFRFIRWLRNFIHSNVSYSQAIARLRELYSQRV